MHELTLCLTTLVLRGIHLCPQSQAPSSTVDAADAAEQFRKVFGKFASAEEVTGVFVRDDSDDDDDDTVRDVWICVASGVDLHHSTGTLSCTDPCILHSTP